MSASVLWNPSEPVLIWGVNVLLHVSILAALALAFAWTMRRHPTLRHSLLLSSMLLMLFSPVGALLMQASGKSLLTVRLAPPDADAPTAEPVAAKSAPSRVVTRTDPRLDAFDAETQPASSAPLALDSNDTARSAPWSAVVAPTTSGISEVIRNVMPLLLLVWLVVALLRLARITVGYTRVVRILRSARPNTDPQLAQSIQRVARALRLQRLPELVFSTSVSGPLSASLLRPRIVLPEGIADRVRPQQLRDVLVHESAHIVRRDQAVVLLQNIAAAIFWLHPLVHLVNRRLAEAREEICDNYVLSATDGPSYSRTLLDLAGMVRPSAAWPGAVGLFTSHWQLQRRVAGLLDERRNTMIRITARGAALVLVMSALMITFAALTTMGVAEAAQAQGGADEQAAPGSSQLDAVGGSADDAFTIRGRVLNSKDEPVAGASIFDRMGEDGQTRKVAQTDRNGLFLYSIPRKSFSPAYDNIPNAQVKVAAVAQGFAFGWTDLQYRTLGEVEATIRLADEVPIEGRIISSDGQALGNVEVTVDHVSEPTTLSVAEYIHRIRRDGNGYLMYKRVWDWSAAGQTRTVRTDADGRFRIAGVGGEHVVRLALSGENVHQSDLTVVARKPVPGAQSATGAIQTDGTVPLAIYYASFTHVSPPHRTLRGIVRDQKTGMPVAGIRVAFPSAASSRAVDITDQHGRFRFPGCLKQPQYRLVVSALQQPYFSREINVEDTDGLDAIDVTIELAQGIRMTGRLTDKESGEPVKGAVKYYPLAPNPHTSRIGSVAFPCYQQTTNDDGRYEIQVLPGPGVVCVYSHANEYEDDYIAPVLDLAEIRRVAGDQASTRNMREFLDTDAGNGATRPLGLREFKAVQLISPEEGATEIEQNLVFVRGRRVEGVVVDKDGNPVKGVMITGLTNRELFSLAPQPTERFTVKGLGPSETRVLLAFDPKHSRAARLEVRGDREAPVTATLQPCGTAVGKVVDDQADGKPVADLRVDLSRGMAFGLELWSTRTNANGEFKVPNLIPHEKYSVTFDRPNRRMNIILDGVVVDAGETKDLGALKLSGGRL